MSKTKKIKTYSVEEAIQYVAQFGLTDVHVYDHATLKTRVNVFEEYTNAGKSYAIFRYAHGKYRGNKVGSAYAN